LAVDEESKLALKLERPSCLWEFLDVAEGRRRALAPSHGYPVSFPLPQSEPSCTFAAFDGSWEEGLLFARRILRGGDFSTPEDFLKGMKLGDEVELTSGVTLAGVTEALFGPGSNFCCKIAALGVDGEGPQLPPLRPLHHEDAPWCGTSFASFKIAVPVLGRRTLEEQTCLVLARGVLAVHASTKILLGFGIGTVASEKLYLFSQCSEGGPVHLRAFGLSPPGMHAQKALDGMKGKWLPYVQTAQEVLARTSPQVLQMKPAEKKEDVEDCEDWCSTSSANVDGLLQWAWADAIGSFRSRWAWSKPMTAIEIAEELEAWAASSGDRQVTLQAAPQRMFSGNPMEAAQWVRNSWGWPGI